MHFLKLSFNVTRTWTQRTYFGFATNTFLFGFSAKYSKSGFTILLMAETDEATAVEALDKAIALIMFRVRYEKFIIWKPNAESPSRELRCSKIKVGYVFLDNLYLTILQYNIC